MNLLEFVISDDNLTYNLIYNKKIYELTESEIQEVLSESEFKELIQLKELTIADWSRPSAIMPIIKRTSAKRKEIAGDEKVLSKFLGVSGKADSPIVNFRTKSTDKTETYRTKIQLIDLNKWRQDKYLYSLTLSEFKEILKVCDIKLYCECPFWHWGGLKYMATELNSAIDKTSISNPVWSKRPGYAEPSLCKHLKGVIKLVSPNAKRILEAIKDRYSSKQRVSRS